MWAFLVRAGARIRCVAPALRGILRPPRSTPEAPYRLSCSFWRYLGSGSPVKLLVKLIAAVSIASTTMPALNSRPLRRGNSLSVARIWSARLYACPQQ